MRIYAPVSFDLDSLVLIPRVDTGICMFLTYTRACSRPYASRAFLSVKRTCTSVSVSVFYVLTYIVTTFSNDVTV